MTTTPASKPAIQSMTLWGTLIAGLPAAYDLFMQAAGSGALGPKAVAIAAVFGSVVAAIGRVRTEKPKPIEGIVTQQ